jgi:hypothetical protein
MVYRGDLTETKSLWDGSAVKSTAEPWFPDRCFPPRVTFERVAAETEELARVMRAPRRPDGRHSRFRTRMIQLYRNLWGLV